MSPSILWRHDAAAAIAPRRHFVCCWMRRLVARLVEDLRARPHRAALFGSGMAERLVYLSHDSEVHHPRQSMCRVCWRRPLMPTRLSISPTCARSAHGDRALPSADGTTSSRTTYQPIAASQRQSHSMCSFQTPWRLGLIAAASLDGEDRMPSAETGDHQRHRVEQAGGEVQEGACRNAPFLGTLLGPGVAVALARSGTAAPPDRSRRPASAAIQRELQRRAGVEAPRSADPPGAGSVPAAASPARSSLRRDSDRLFVVLIEPAPPGRRLRRRRAGPPRLQRWTAAGGWRTMYNLHDLRMHDVERQDAEDLVVEVHAMPCRSSTPRNRPRALFEVVAGVSLSRSR